MKLFKYKKFLAVLCAAILLFTYLSIPSSAYANIMDYDHSTILYPSNTPLRQDCPVPIDIEYSFSIHEEGSYASLTNLVSSTLLPFVSGDTLDTSSDFVVSADVFSSSTFGGMIYSDSFDVELFNSDPSLYFIGSADFSFSDVSLYFDSDSTTNYIYTTRFVTFILRDFYCWDYSFESRINTVDSEVSLSFDLESLDLPLDSIHVYYALSGDSQLNYIKFDSSNYPGLLTGDITFTPEMFGYTHDTIVYIYSAEIYFYNGMNQPPASGLIPFSFDTHYVFNPYVHNVNYAGSPGGSLPLADYTSWISDAASGFLDFEIYDGFTLGGIFMCVVAFLCAMWFLKLVAGG